ncbi:GDSL-type esterase/lipase family protein [Xenorhabdus sp. XENO-1]|uniref:DUF459 domain-containing protein n=1 Tax=Xenorhabdus bovienii TaxID=40576 RepID=UPI0020CA365F|nr:GDSL-type esterase/lipase family protein [Xenorhabdus bovienii]MCP9269165.1 GDSL-type esterase/lipase family protein [Xenorhabdus bovienii subsp. africana]
MNKFIFTFLLLFCLNSYSKPLFLGDSLTYQISYSYNKISPLSALYMSGSGLSSNRIINWRNYVRKINYSHYDSIYVMLGTNDFISERQKESYYFKVIYFIRELKIHSNNKPIIWLLPPPLADKNKNQLLKNTRNVIINACLNENVFMIDTRHALGMGYTEKFNGIPIRTNDGIHITEHGADRVVGLLFSSVTY